MGHPQLSAARQCVLVGLAESTFYLTPAAPSDEVAQLTRRIDEIFTEAPCFGARRIAAVLCREGYQVDRKRIGRLMRLMGLEAIYCRPKTSQPHPGHRIYPYLLRGITIGRPNQVWCTDITYIRMPKGWAYLVAIMDWHSRYVLAWRISNTLDVKFCIEALQEALLCGKPEIFNTDQGSQFTSDEFTGLLLSHGIKVSMDGRGRFLDNIFIERLWRSVKYEEVYLKEYRDLTDARQNLGSYFLFYNRRRVHQSLDYKTPAEAYVA